MAHLKGGTFVDGKLYVQDAIVVNKIQAPDGTAFPYINIENKSFNSSNPAVGHLVSFSTAQGGLDNSPISYRYEPYTTADGKEADIIKIAFIDKGNTLVTLDKIHFDNVDGELRLKDDRTWEFV